MHTDRQFDLSWPVLYFLSYKARGVLLGLIVLWPVVVFLIAYLQESSFEKAATLINSIAPPWIIVILASTSVVVFVLDFVLRKRLRIDSQTITLRQPWAIARRWPLSSLADVTFEVNRMYTWDDFHSFCGSNDLSYVHMVLCNSSSQEQVTVGGTMSANVAEDLANQIKKYIPAATSKGLRHRSPKND